MKVSSAGVAVAAMVVSAVAVTVVTTGIASGAPSASAKLPATFQMYANVDQLGDLGSNVEAKSVETVSARYQGHSWNYYQVTFKRSIGKCAAQAQAGFAGGELTAGGHSSEVDNIGSTTFRVRFTDPISGRPTSSAFMLTVTCPS